MQESRINWGLEFSLVILTEEERIMVFEGIFRGGIVQIDYGFYMI